MEGLFGIRAHQSGKIYYKGKELRINKPRDAISNGLCLLTEDRRATGIMGVPVRGRQCGHFLPEQILKRRHFH